MKKLQEVVGWYKWKDSQFPNRYQPINSRTLIKLITKEGSGYDLSDEDQAQLEACSSLYKELWAEIVADEEKIRGKRNAT